MSCGPLRSRALRLALLCLLANLSGSWAARAATVDLANGLRGGRCGGRAAPHALLEVPALDGAARRWALGTPLAQALDASDYRARRSSGLTLSGWQDTRDLMRLMAERFCTQLSDPQFTQLGVYQRGHQLWLVIAAPHPSPRIDDPAPLQREVLALTNQARAEPRRCGSRAMPAVAPLRDSPLLDRSAQMQASDMARHHFFDHTGSDGSTPADRARRAGYAWRAVGENIALGPETAAEVVRGWLGSPGHCENIMDANYTEMGLAAALSPGLHGELYWSQTFGRPR